MAAIPWFFYPVINNYGVFPDPDFNGPKPDINFAVPDGVAITTLLGGTVSGVNSPSGAIPSWGQVVTVKLDTPWNSNALYIAYLHLHSTTVQVGQHITPGTIIGYAGPDAMGLRWRVGLALQSGPYYGFGSGFSNPGSPALNPTQLLNEALAGKIQVPGPTGNPNPTTGGSGNSVLDLVPAIPALAGVAGLGFIIAAFLLVAVAVAGIAILYKKVGS